jgi:invasion protein IalB
MKHSRASDRTEARPFAIGLEFVTMVRFASVLAVLAVSTFGSGAALAQQGKPGAAPAGKASAAPAPVSADPAATSATYGDWVLRCQRVGEADKAQRICEVAQTIKLQNQQQPIAEIALGHLPADHTLHLTVVLPPSVSFPSTVQFATADKPPQSVDLQWRRCIPGGCFAEVAPSDESIKAWRGSEDAGRITFKDAAGRDVTLPVSFRGLAQALDALGKV